MRWSRSPLFCAPKVALMAVLSYASSTHTASPTPRQAVEASGSKHPEARVFTARQEEALVKRNAASTLFPGLTCIEHGEHTDRFNQNRGSRKIEAAIYMLLWSSRIAIAPAFIASLKRLDPVVATDFSLACDHIAVTPFLFSHPLIKEKIRLYSCHG